ncbi:MAG: arsenic efflux protein [Clostridia bacterium]|nr:arsenic efflux protein [Clostridia bacterium]
MLEVIQDTLLDSIKLLPFLFLTYLLMEYIEHKTSKKAKDTIKKSGKFGPLLGSLLGIVPQCGFSVSATNLYAGRVITLGTLISVYLSTSDEMLPIMISESAPITTILTILLIKFTIGMITGFIIDLILRLRKKNEEEEKIVDICEKDHCHCEKGIVKSAIHHTLHIFLFIVIVIFILNLVIYFIGEENISKFLENQPILGPAISSLIGLIPNCASSVIITEMYLGNVINVGTLIAGLLVNAGVGLVVLFKTNKGIKENIKIVSLLYFIGLISGIVIQAIGVTL